jgi:hypothetical protein
MADKMGYRIELVQINRFTFENEEFMLVDIVEEKPQPKPGSTKVLGDWDWNFYEREHGKEATAQFRKAVEAVQKFVQLQGWDLTYNLNKYYTGFKLGNKVVFSVNWGGTHAWNVRFKIPEEMFETFETGSWEFQRYDNSFDELIIRPKDRESSDINELEELLIAAYKHISGTL